MQPNGATPNPIGSVLVLVGVVLATGAVLSLGRSLGIEAANRGVQTHGLYRFVRHPIYAAYLPLMGGYLRAIPHGGTEYCLSPGWRARLRVSSAKKQCSGKMRSIKPMQDAYVGG